MSYPARGEGLGKYDISHVVSGFSFYEHLLNGILLQAFTIDRTLVLTFTSTWWGYDVDTLHIKRKDRSELADIEDAASQGFEAYSKNSRTKWILADNNSSNKNNTWTNRKTEIIKSRKQKWEEKQLYEHLIIWKIVYGMTWTWLWRRKRKRETESFLMKKKLATVVEGDPKAPLSIATTPRCRGGCYSFPWIAPLYPWSVP